VFAAAGAEAGRDEVVSDCFVVDVGALLDVATVVDAALEGEPVAVTSVGVAAGAPEALTESACRDRVTKATTSVTAATATTQDSTLSANKGFTMRRIISISQLVHCDTNRAADRVP
jgi:hypothetical protein